MSDLKNMSIGNLREFCMNPSQFHTIKHSVAFLDLVNRLADTEAERDRLRDKITYIEAEKKNLEWKLAAARSEVSDEQALMIAYEIIANWIPVEYWDGELDKLCDDIKQAIKQAASGAAVENRQNKENR